MQAPYRMNAIAAYFALVTICVVAGCAAPPDLSAINQYASTTAQSADAFAKIAADYQQSCLRLEKVNRGVVETSSSAQGATLVTDRPDLTQFFIPNASPNPGYTSPPGITAAPAPAAAVGMDNPKTPGDCAVAGDVSTSWSNANGSVLDDVKALGNLAGVDTVPSPNPSPLVSGLTAAGVSAPITQAVSQLISTISSYFLNKERGGDITQFLTAVQPYFPHALQALEQVDADYTKRLTLEYRATLNQYNGYAGDEIKHADDSCIRRVNRQKPPTTALGTCKQLADQRTARRLLAARSVVEASVDEINTRLQASQAYGTAVENIAKTQQGLYDASQRGATFADYLKIVQDTGEPIITNLTALAKAVK